MGGGEPIPHYKASPRRLQQALPKLMKAARAPLGALTNAPQSALRPPTSRTSQAGASPAAQTPQAATPVLLANMGLGGLPTPGTQVRRAIHHRRALGCGAPSAESFRGGSCGQDELGVPGARPGAAPKLAEICSRWETRRLPSPRGARCRLLCACFAPRG